ncbi:Hypothetical protein AA314_03469 [Archangium gephyra]|uniref:Uncharacterized protein n=1 Tax=Archangium gephyra TaxID=48 RepID=A0AAC8TDJ7_9BACT|nr:Hypothetical protein AA314_03469 [Archangium gephyra]
MSAHLASAREEIFRFSGQEVGGPSVQGWLELAGESPVDVLAHSGPAPTHSKRGRFSLVGLPCERPRALPWPLAPLWTRGPWECGGPCKRPPGGGAHAQPHRSFPRGECLQ